VKRPRHVTLRGRRARGGQDPLRKDPVKTLRGVHAERDHASAFGVARARARARARFDFRFSLVAAHPRGHSGLTTVPNVSRNQAPWRRGDAGDDFVGTLRDEWSCRALARVFRERSGEDACNGPQVSRGKSILSRESDVIDTRRRFQDSHKFEDDRLKFEFCCFLLALNPPRGVIVSRKRKGVTYYTP